MAENDGSQTPETQKSQVLDEEKGPGGESKSIALWTYLTSNVDPAKCTPPLAGFCFMTGFIDVISFSAIFVWCGFQTGNFAQLALALARLFNGPRGQRDQTFHLADQQALTSLLSFNAGAFIGRLGDHIGAHTRIWLFIGTMIQALLTTVAALTLWKSGEPSVSDARAEPVWSNPLSFVAIAFMSASLGVQGIQGKRLNTQFTTTIVLTTVWVELMSDPKLFNLRRKVITRDHKLIAAFFLFLGGFVGRALLQTIGSPATLGIGVGLRVLIALSWLFVPGPSSQKSSS